MEPPEHLADERQPARRPALRWLTSLLVGVLIVALATWAFWQRVPDEPGPPADYAEVRVADVRTGEGPAGHALVLREVGGSRQLVMVIGEAEALAIALELAGQRAPRPMTHDLLRSMIQALDARVMRVQVTRLESGTYYAAVVLHRGQRRVEIDARPSDAIALALRAAAPIYARRSLFEGERQRVPATTF